MTVNPAGNRFCENCGKQFQLTCVRCGHDVNLLARFCGNCGSMLNEGPPPMAADALPKWGELKQATVLFADVVGSTDLVAHMDPEEAMARLRPAVLRMRHSVERFGGKVLRTLGDGVMAMFGVPRALEGHALLACQAALHMQAVFRHGGDGLQIRVGLHSGQVASDPSDAEDGRGGGAHGVTIHLASRVIALAQPDSIYLTAACRAAAGPGCESETMGLYPLKGIPQPVEILRLNGAVSGAPHRLLTRETTFWGRQGELRRLLSALDEARANRGNTIAIAGEPGAGKSRLCQEFAQLCRENRVPVHEVRAQLYGHALPLQPILELFRQHFFRLTASDDSAVARERIDQCFAPVTTLASDLQLLHEFFGAGQPDAPALALGPRARQARLLDMVRALVRQQADIERVILVEDLHWLDEASEEFVSVLVDAVVGTRTLLLLNYRTAYRPPWSDSPYFEQIDLAELSAADMEALVAELLAPLMVQPEVCELVCRRARGNPFFAEELARALAESNLIATDTGLPAGGIDAVERALPGTIEAVISARLDRVGEPEKTLLQMCAIIGKEIPLAVLEHVASPIANQIQVGLDGLCHAGLILPQPADGGRRFAFHHPLIQEVAYKTQLRVRRQQVHATVAAAMELYYAEQMDEYAALIGYHFEQAGKFVEAAKYYECSATWLGSMNPAQAIRHWRNVRDLLVNVARTDEIERQRATAGAKITTLGWREGMSLSEVKPLIDEALQFARQGDDRLVPWLLTIEGRMLVASGGAVDQYVDKVKQAFLYIDMDRDAGRVALAHTFLSHAYSWAGRLREALAANDIALANAAEVDAFDRAFIGFSIEQWMLSIRSKVLARMARVDEARLALGRLLELGVSPHEPPVPGVSHFGFLELAWAMEDADLAQEHARKLPELAQKHGTPYLGIVAQCFNGVALGLAGWHSRSHEAYTSALSLLRASGAAREHESEVVACLAESCLHLSDYAAAFAYADEAVALSRVRTTRLAECRALIVRGQAALMLGMGQAGVQEDFARAEALIEITGAAACRRALDRGRVLSVVRTA